MILTKPKSVNAGPSSGTGEGVAHSKRWYVALVRMHHHINVAAVQKADAFGLQKLDLTVRSPKGKCA